MKTFGFQWHVTDRCNRRCAHCYQDVFNADAEIGLDGLCSMADRIFAAVSDRTVSVNVTGGEPLLLPYLFDLVDHLHTFKNLGEVNIITNGTVVTDEAISRLKRCKKLGSIKVSLESADEARNDAIRGEGCFKKAVEGVLRLRGTGKPVVR